MPVKEQPGKHHYHLGSEVKGTSMDDFTFAKPSSPRKKQSGSEIEMLPISKHQHESFNQTPFPSATAPGKGYRKADRPLKKIYPAMPTIREFVDF